MRKEVGILVEEKMKLCEKIGSLTESCSLKDHSNEYRYNLGGDNQGDEAGYGKENVGAACAGTKTRCGCDMAL